MRLVTYASDRGPRAGALLDTAIVDIFDALGADPPGAAPSVRSLLESGRIDEAAAAVADAAAERWGESWDRDGAPATLLTDAEAHLPRFGSEEWTWRA